MLLDEGLCDVFPPVSCHRSFHSMSSWIPGHTYECRERITLPLFVSRAPPKRPSKLDPDCCSHDDLVAFVCATQECSRAQRGSSFPTSPRTILKSTASPTCASGLSHSLPLNRAHEHIRRVPDKSRQNDALAVNLVVKFLLQHTHVCSREALDPSHSVFDRTISDSFPPSSSRPV